MSRTVHHVALALVHKNGQWLVALRRDADHLGGLWEFPGGKIHRDESPAQAALRELREECAVEAAVERVLAPHAVEYADRLVHLTPVVCRWIDGEPQPHASQACRWAAAADLARLDMPAANAPIIRDALAMSTVTNARGDSASPC